MRISMYQASAVTFVHILSNLDSCLKKSEAYAAARKIDPTVLVNARLFPDMFPLARQIQIASDQSKGCVARLSGAEPPKFEDNEKTFEELHARIEKTIAFIKTFKPEQLDGTEERKIEIKTRDGMRTYQGLGYLLDSVLPNFYFHVVTAYDVLRHNGVEIGKPDFLGDIPKVPRN
jgi:hypothetical protein